MNSGMLSFPQSVVSHFGWLQRAYHFRISRNDESQVEFTTPYCRVMVASEKSDLFVEISSNESESIRRIKFSLNELLVAKESVPLPDPPSRGARSSVLDHGLRTAAQLLSEHGSDVLAGDFSIRPRIVRMQVSAWLESKCQEVMGKPRSRSVEDGVRQVIWEFSKKTEEQKSEIRKVLSEWIANGADQRRGFAENLIKHI
jgi:hypothetical protein